MKPIGRLVVYAFFTIASVPLRLLASSLRRRAQTQWLDSCVSRKRRALAPAPGQARNHLSSSRDPQPWAIPQLQPELLAYVAVFLPPNEVAATLRLVNKAAAKQFTGPKHRRIRLSQPVPHHAFARQWRDPSALRGLTLEGRMKLVCLTAASGSITNLKVLAKKPDFDLYTSEVFAGAAGAGRLALCRWLRRTARCPWGEDVAEAAVAGGHLRVCKWLLEQGCPYRPRRLLSVAAAGGHRALCEWLLESGFGSQGGHGPRAAARAGHGGLMAELLRRLAPEQVGVGRLLACVAAGCDLLTLKLLHHAYIEASHGSAARAAPASAASAAAAAPAASRRGGPALLEEPSASHLVAAAAGSSTPDWREKVDWLRAMGYPKTPAACEAAAEAPCGAAARLAWLCQRGFPLEPWVACAAARRGDPDALAAVLDAGVAVDVERVVLVAAGKGHLPVLQLLQDRGLGEVGAATAGEAAEAAARGGHQPVVQWLADRWAAPLTQRLFNAAAESGSLTLLEWLRQRGCAWDASAFAWCAWVGSVEQLEWLAANGCPMGDDGEPYLWAGYNSDFMVLRCLRRLGCPWGRDGSTFTNAVCLQDYEEDQAGAGAEAGAQGEGAAGEEEGSGAEAGWWCRLDVLKWLVSEGCPVDWAAAERVARRQRREEADLLGWIAEQKRKQQEQQQQQQHEQREQ